VYNVARRMLSSDVDAEDVTQDVLLQVVRKLPSFRGESAFPTWLHRITVNTALSHRRKQAVHSEHGVGNAPDEVLEQGHPPRSVPGAGDRETNQGPVPQLLSREAQAHIERAIDGLPETYRTVFLLADVEGLPNATIAESLRLSVPAVKSRLHRARLLMRDALAPYFEEIAVADNG
jgi:RNA polymerase sigma-70 factor (ECF subfamily)